MADVKGEGDPAKRPNTPPGAMSREDLFKQSDDQHDNDAEFVDVQDEDHDKLTEVVEETEQVEAKSEAVQEKKFKVKVNGQDREFTEAELIERASKAEAADQRFQEAARLKREAEELKQASQKAPAEPEVTDDDLALARALQMGSEEEAAKVIKKMRSPTLSKDDVIRTVDERTTFQSSVQRFQTEYPELFADPYLSKLVAMKDEEMVKNGDTRPYYDRYKSIGEEMKSWLGKVKPATTEKQERKASIVTLKTAAGRVVEKTDEDEEQSTSDTIANMAKARGQGYAK